MRLARPVAQLRALVCGRLKQVALVFWSFVTCKPKIKHVNNFGHERPNAFCVRGTKALCLIIT